MNILHEKFKETSFKYGIIFLVTGIIVYLYSKIIFNFVEDVDIGQRFNNNGFYESELFKIIGFLQILVGIFYLFIDLRASFYLIDKATIRNYWFTTPFILIFLIIPLLDKYYPTEKNRGSILMMFIDTYLIFSTFLFLIGIYYFFYNMVKSIYSHYVIEKNWK